METTLYKAKESDMDWVNTTYANIKFMLSDLNNEYVVIADADGEKIGVGRLIQIGNKLELGGMYVDSKHRGKGIAKRIVEHLLQQAPKGVLVYCIPFKHLEAFYKSFGFEDAEINDAVPQEIKTKIGYCSQTYSTDTSLLQLVK